MHSEGRILFVASLPKAGTYICAAILERLGLFNTNWDIGYDKTMLSGAPDGRLLDFEIDSDRANNITRFVDIDRNVIARLMTPGQFAVGHLPPHVFDPAIIMRLEVIFLFRPFKDILLSTFFYYNDMLPEERVFAQFASEQDINVRFYKYLGHILPSTVALWNDMLNWFLFRNCMPVRFEDMADPNRSRDTVCRITEFLGIDRSEECISDAALRSVQDNTVTKNKVSNESRLHVWSDECERLFCRLGCDALEGRYAEFARRAAF